MNLSDKVKNKNYLIQLALAFAILNSFIIVLAKFYGWYYSNSQVMFASAIDSLLDLFSSIVNIVALKISLNPPDHNHRFGHEKFQDLAIFAQSIFFIIMSIFTFFSSVYSLIYHKVVFENSSSMLNIIYLCSFLTFLLIFYQTYTYHKTKSQMIASDKLHYITDFLTNIAVIISLYFYDKFWYIDSLSGILIAIYILYSSYKLLNNVIKNLADEELSNDEKRKILQVICSFPLVKGIHDLKTRYAAHKAFIQCHIELDGTITLNEAHQITELITDELSKVFPHCEVIIHQDPQDVEEIVQYRETIIE